MASQKIHIFFFPFLARGHTIPLLETSRLLAERDPDNIRCSFVTTPANSSYVLPAIQSAAAKGLSLDLLLIPFPSAEVGLPSGVECTDSLSSDDPSSIHKLMRAVNLLQHPFEDLVTKHHPTCIISDFTISWPAHVATSRSLPYFLFSTVSPFSACVIENIYFSGAHLSSDDNAVVGPLSGLPHPLQLTKPELPPMLAWPAVFEETRAAEEKSCGLLFNSFDELAPEYNEQCRRNMPGSGSVYCVGPVQLNKSVDATWDRKWLDSKPDDSVVYAGFGSEWSFGGDQLREIALGLASCGHPFIWVVRGGPKPEEWVPEEFEAAVESGRGVILTEWAPQVAILNHRATGGFLSHCGWSSVIEAACAGLPAIAWPLHSEQFINERFVVDVLKIGVRILDGSKQMMRSVRAEMKGVVKAEAIKGAVQKLMGGGDEEVTAMRIRASEYAKMARAATAEGGSSYVNIGRVVELIRGHGNHNN